jgi:hypothetical protein
LQAGFASITSALPCFVPGFGALQIKLERYERDDGFSSDFIIGLGISALAWLTALAVWELLHRQPVMNVRLLRSKAFAISCLMMFAVFFIADQHDTTAATAIAGADGI